MAKLGQFSLWGGCWEVLGKKCQGGASARMPPLHSSHGLPWPGHGLSVDPWSLIYLYYLFPCSLFLSNPNFFPQGSGGSLPFLFNALPASFFPSALAPTSPWSEFQGEFRSLFRLRGSVSETGLLGDGLKLLEPLILWSPDRADHIFLFKTQLVGGDGRFLRRVFNGDMVLFRDQLSSWARGDRGNKGQRKSSW